MNGVGVSANRIAVNVVGFTLWNLINFKFRTPVFIEQYFRNTIIINTNDKMNKKQKKDFNKKLELVRTRGNTGEKQQNFFKYECQKMNKMAETCMYT